MEVVNRLFVFATVSAFFTSFRVTYELTQALFGAQPWWVCALAFLVSIVPTFLFMWFFSGGTLIVISRVKVRLAVVISLFPWWVVAYTCRNHLHAFLDHNWIAITLTAFVLLLDVVHMRGRRPVEDETTQWG
jgi:hypothetical protein